MEKVRVDRYLAKLEKVVPSCCSDCAIPAIQCHGHDRPYEASCEGHGHALAEVGLQAVLTDHQKVAKHEYQEAQHPAPVLGEVLLGASDGLAVTTCNMVVVVVSMLV
eukprot:scaffold408028_cov50-Prasinocladus_malaysianus.AAC.1